MYKHNNEIMCSLDVTVTNYKCATETIHIYLDKLYSLCQESECEICQSSASAESSKSIEKMSMRVTHNILT